MKPFKAPDEEIRFSDYGIEIRFRSGKYFINYDGGEIAIQYREHEISEAEALRAQTSPEEAGRVIAACQSRDGYSKGFV